MTAKLPERDGQLGSRIRSPAEQHERVVTESELTAVSEGEAAPGGGPIDDPSAGTSVSKIEAIGRGWSAQNEPQAGGWLLGLPQGDPAHEGVPVSALVTRIDLDREHANLSSTLRIYVLDHYRRLAEEAAPGGGKTKRS